MTPQFSPDGKWISYSKQDKLARTHVWLKELATGQEHMIASDQFQISQGAKWTPDGKKLLLIGGVSLPAMASQGFRGTPTQLYAISLTRVEKDPDRSRHQYRGAGAGSSWTKRRPADAAGAAPPRPRNVQVKIEWDGMERRMQKLTSSTGPVMSVVPAPDSRTYAFMAGGFGGGRRSGRGRRSRPLHHRRRRQPDRSG